jgi:type I restriction enzyme S subunit
VTELPRGWTWAKLSDVCEINPPLDLALGDEDLCSFIPMAAVEVESGRADPSQTGRYGELRRKSYRPFRERDVLFAKITPSMENGKAAVANQLANGVGFGSTEFHVLRSRGAVEPRYVLHYVLQRSFRDEAAHHMTGTAGQRRVPARYLDSTPIPVPPLAEQRRIVAAIEEHLSRLDVATQSLQEGLGRVAVLRAAAITSLIEGPWPRRPWKEVGRSQNGRAFPSRDYSDTGVKLLRPGNLHSSGRVVWTSTNTRYLPDRYGEEFPHYIVGPGELVMNLTAQSLKDEFLGRVCLTGEDERCLLNQRQARLTPFDANPKYLLYVFKAKPFRRFVDSLNKGSLIQHMFTSQLDSFDVPLPPLPEQERIVIAIETRLAALDALSTAADIAQRRSRALRRSIVACAFRGELVPQDPQEEPASVLLERIAAERAATPTTTRKRQARTPA